MSRGALPNVLRGMGVTDGSTMGSVGPGRQQAPCPLCGEELQFGTGDYGQTLEQCPTQRCANHVPHRPVRAPETELLPTFTPKVRRKS